jgi:hypothetical protein
MLVNLDEGFPTVYVQYANLDQAFRGLDTWQRNYKVLMICLLSRQSHFACLFDFPDLPLWEASNCEAKASSL